MYEFDSITTEELQKKLEEGEKLELVDVREDEEVAAGTIPGVKHIKMGEIPENLDFDALTDQLNAEIEAVYSKNSFFNFLFINVIVSNSYVLSNSIVKHVTFLHNYSTVISP